MIPDIAKKGASFKGALAYYLHDKREAGERERFTSERVAWTETRNLMTNDPEMAGKVMAATAMDADRLKRDAGVRNTGRKSDQSVYAYTLSWHPDEAPTLSRAEMMRAADETISVLGAEDRQALIVCHDDRPHPHVHVIVNRVSPEDGRMLATGNDRLKLSQWALGYRQARGEEHYCPKRAENWDMRLSRHDDNEKLKYWRAESDEPRSMAEDIKKAKAANDPKAEKLVSEFKKKLAKLSADGKAMKDRHGAEWKDLGKGYRARKDQIYRQTENGIQDVRANIKHAYRPQWQELGRRHSRERREFYARETRVSGKIRNAIDAVVHARKLDPDSSRGFLGGAFNYLTSSTKRADALERLHKAQVRELSAAQRAEVGAAIKSLKGERSALLSSARGSFLSERAALIQRQATDKQQLKSAWRRHNDERKRAFEASRGFAKSKQESKERPEPSRGAARAEQNRAARAGRKRPGRSRKRSRKKE
ncbi:relaxase/mobilization nuclease domain-containing protein [uncultured Shimia sp.]|uniref:relaxase/mobilization nuclease domain-containing protein n=1 Tax=uncultured Shimia sp. TaxID=573152 RepID=UPI00262C63DB|nr:relaxase/mobilization nuclease domain-containing protein [uncultured Shimia sp.]